VLERFARGDYCGIDIVSAGGVDGYDFGFIAGEMLDLDELAGGHGPYVGLMEVTFLPSLLFTHSLLMKRPVG
jgi:hypothetical protein